MNARHFICVATLWCASCCVVIAQPLALPAPPAAALEQRLGAALPFQLPLRDEAGLPVRLGDYFRDGRPVLLVLGYYRCPQLCGLLMQGLLAALHESGVSLRDWRIVGISIDPEDTPETARTRREIDLAYARFIFPELKAASLDLHLLIATPGALQQLAPQVGFNYTAVSDNSVATPARYAHPAAVIVATPNGKVSRYLAGIQFDSNELKVALADARGDRVGGITSRIALLCAHYDPRVGRHSSAVMSGMRVLGVTLAALLAIWCWRRRTPHGGTS